MIGHVFFFPLSVQKHWDWETEQCVFSGKGTPIVVLVTVGALQSSESPSNWIWLLPPQREAWRPEGFLSILPPSVFNRTKYACDSVLSFSQHFTPHPVIDWLCYSHAGSQVLEGFSCSPIAPLVLGKLCLSVPPRRSRFSCFSSSLSHDHWV